MQNASIYLKYITTRFTKPRKMQVFSESRLPQDFKNLGWRGQFFAQPYRKSDLKPNFLINLKRLDLWSFRTLSVFNFKE